MAAVDGLTFEGTFNSPTTGLFKDNATHDIGADDLRALVTAIKESYLNKIDTGTFIDEEVPSGTVNGSNVNFTLANTPKAGSLKLYSDGIRMRGGGIDYTLSGANITMGIAPTSQILADYRI